MSNNNNTTSTVIAHAKNGIHRKLELKQLHTYWYNFTGRWCRCILNVHSCGTQLHCQCRLSSFSC